MSGETRGPNATRRAFVAGLIALPALGMGDPTDTADTVARFRALSARLTGFPVEALDPTFAQDMIDGFLARGDGRELERLLSGDAPDTQGDLTRRIAAAWYSGMHPTDGGTAVHAFREALVWRALPFTRPPGSCSGAPGDWSRPPVLPGAER